MSEILDTIVQYLEQDGWPVLLVPNETIAVTSYHGSSGKWECQLHLREEQQQIVFYSVCPVNVPEEKRLAMAEYITRANYGLALGNLEMDMEDGDVRFKTSLDLAPGATVGSVKPLVDANVVLFDRYLPGIMHVMNGTMSPKEAVAAVEEQAPAAEPAN